ncbi:MAG TPA: RdgB/HAM1 family non-canonical purine NTP pyrophosphatase [Thermoleophilaceae bacterium]|jgi:XTP/dITP diphosphohydrolase
MRLVLATRNAHKLRELEQIVPEHELLPLPDEVELPPETGDTFAANAVIKAEAAARATGLPTIADDSGIEAAALGGAPGVRSARYAGESATDEENLAKLLREVGPGDDPRLAYVCVLAFVDGSSPPVLFEGRCTGTITHDPRGEHGFGYDPAFVPDDRDDGLTMAELDPAVKDTISHRGRAARELAAWLRAREAEGAAA